MKRLIFIFFIICFFYGNTFAEDFASVSVSSFHAMVDKINQFRKAPFDFIYLNMDSFKNIDKKKLKDLFGLWMYKRSEFIKTGLPYLNYNQCLEELAKDNLFNIYEKGKISKVDSKIINNSCNTSFTGEVLMALAFQNYVSVENFLDIIYPTIFEKAMGLNDPDTSPIVFPYNMAGAAIFRGEVVLSNIRYNIYIVDIIFAVDKIKKGEVFGYVNNISNKMNIDKIVVYDSYGEKCSKIAVWPDGSFYGILPKEGIYDFEFDFSNSNIHKIINYENGKVVDVFFDF